MTCRNCGTIDEKDFDGNDTLCVRCKEVQTEAEEEAALEEESPDVEELPDLKEGDIE